MANVTDINEYKKTPEDQPDEGLYFTDENNIKWFKYCASYTDKSGTPLVFHLWAINAEDAEARLLSLKENGKIDGKLFSEVDC